MASEAASQRLERARMLERQQRVDEAALAYLEAEEPDEAARVLIAVKRFADAGRLLLRLLRIPPTEVQDLDERGKRLAHKAALCCWKAGEHRKSFDLLVALGDMARAEKLLEEIGDKVGLQRLREQMTARKFVPDMGEDITIMPNTVTSGVRVAAKRTDSPESAAKLEAAGDRQGAYEMFLRLGDRFNAARMLSALGKHLEAAQLLEVLKMPYEAATAHYMAGNLPGALQCLRQVPPRSNRYSRACLHAIKFAQKLGAFDADFFAFLGPFLATAPTDEQEAEALYFVAEICEKNEDIDEACMAYESILQSFPRHRDVPSRLALLRGKPGGAVQEHGDRSSSLAFLDDPPSSVAIQVPRFTPGGSLAAVVPQASGSTAKVASSPGIKAMPGGARPATGDRGRDAATGSSGETTDFQPGERVADRYRIEGILGKGGMATVYKALDEELDEFIAMKVFASRADDPQMITRFKQEVQLSRQLLHPNIVRLYDFGTQRDLRFITMELLTGKELGEMTGTPMELKKGLSYLRDACAGLAAVHKKGVVHRDLKPANFFIVDGGPGGSDVLKIMDFGIAKRPGSTGLTVQGFVAGTPEYMSPEQIKDFGKVGHLSDIYALGVIAYELFTGTCPFVHEDIQALLMMHLMHEPPRPQTRNPALPEELDALVMALLEKDPTKRIQSCEEIGERLAVIGETYLR